MVRCRVLSKRSVVCLVSVHEFIFYQLIGKVEDGLEWARDYIKIA